MSPYKHRPYIQFSSKYLHTQYCPEIMLANAGAHNSFRHIKQCKNTKHDDVKTERKEGKTSEGDES